MKIILGNVNSTANYAFIIPGIILTGDILRPVNTGDF